MDIIIHQTLFADDEKHVGFHHDFSDKNITVDAHVIIYSDAFVELQKDLFTELFARLKENLSQGSATIEQFKVLFEKKLQSVNAKLHLLAEKSSSKGPFFILGLVQVFYDQTYLASMIGDVGITVFRKKSINAMLHNDTDPRRQVDTFSEYIEGVIENHDKLLVCGGDIRNYIAKEEFKDVLEVSYSDETPFLELIQSILSQRTDTEALGFLQECHISLASASSKVEYMPVGTGWNAKFIEYLSTYKHYVFIGLGSLFVLFFVTVVVQRILNDPGIPIDDETGERIVLDDVWENVRQFEELVEVPGLNFDEKSSRYDSILESASVLESVDSQAAEEIRQRVTDAFYRSEDIGYVSSLTNAIGSFEYNDTQRDVLGTGHSLIPTVNGYRALGTNGGVFDISLDEENNTVSARSFELAGEEVLDCTPNRFNGVDLRQTNDAALCYTDNDTIQYVTAENGVQQAVLQSGSLWPNTNGLARYLGNLYQLSPADLENNVFIKKFTFSLASGEPVITQQEDSYAIDAELIPESFRQGFSDFLVDADASFLLRSVGESALYQVRQESTLTYTLREVVLSPIGQGVPALSDNIRILAPIQNEADTTTYGLYIADLDNNFIHVYTTSGDGGRQIASRNTSYTGQYVYSIGWDFGMETQDVYVEWNDQTNGQRILHILTDEGVYSFDWEQIVSTLD